MNSGLMNSSPSANMHNVNKLDGPKITTGMPLSNNPLALQNTLKNFFGLAAIRNKQMQSNTFNQYGSFGYSSALFNPLLAREPSVTELVGNGQGIMHKTLFSLFFQFLE